MKIMETMAWGLDRIARKPEYVTAVAGANLGNLRFRDPIVFTRHLERILGLGITRSISGLQTGFILPSGERVRLVSSGIGNPASEGYSAQEKRHAVGVLRAHILSWLKGDIPAGLPEGYRRPAPLDPVATAILTDAGVDPERVLLYADLVESVDFRDDRKRRHQVSVHRPHLELETARTKQRIELDAARISWNGRGLSVVRIDLPQTAKTGLIGSSLKSVVGHPALAGYLITAVTHRATGFTLHAKPGIKP